MADLSTTKLNSKENVTTYLTEHTSPFDIIVDHTLTQSMLLHIRIYCRLFIRLKHFLKSSLLLIIYQVF